MRKVERNKLQTSFMDQLQGADFLAKIFDSFPDTHVFIKDLKGKHIMVNQLLAQGHGETSDSIVGKTAYDFCPKKMADKYATDDQFVTQSGKPIVNREEQVKTDDGLKWFSTTKIPLYNKQNKIVGLVGVTRNIEYLKSLLNQIEKQKQQLEELSKKDSLTGCYNQRYIQEDLLHKILSLGRLGNKKFTVLMFDLDHFKSINDRFGHIAGDKVLIKFSEQIRKSLRRQTDALIRLGGDEFLIALFGTDKKGALQMAKKMLTSLRHIRWPRTLFKGESNILRTSIGIATLKQRESMEDLLKRADQALYKAKARGRNRIEY